MTYAQNFSLATPTGLEEANTLDEIIRNVKIALNERFVDILGVDLSSATDPQRVTKIVIPSAGMTIRNSTDAASLISITNSGATLASPTVTGTVTATGATITGGTVAPTTLTVPNGTAIINAALTTPGIVDAALAGTTVNSGTISGGTVSGATLNNSTFTGTVTGISTDPLVYSTSLTSNVSLAYGGTYTNVLSVSVPSAGTYLGVGQASFGGLGGNLNGGGVGASVVIDDTTNTTHCFSQAVSALTVTGGSGTYTLNRTVTVPFTFVVTVGAATTFRMKVIVDGNTGSPAVTGNASYDSTILSLMKIT